MIGSKSDFVLKQVIALFKNPRYGHIDEILDCLIQIAVAEGRRECLGHDGLHFIIGGDHCQMFDFGDCVGRFRSILAQFYFRAKAQSDSRISGSVYGSDMEATFNLPGRETARMKLHIENTSALPRLLIEYPVV